MLMPAVQPAELWQESGRWENTARNCCASRTATSANSCFGPTHEEVITDVVRRE
jgi:prolyl-tRNA synthetase